MEDKAHIYLVNSTIIIIAKDVVTRNHPHHFQIHNYVSQKVLSFHIKLTGSKSTEEGHLIAAAIERNLYDKLRISITIHVDPDVQKNNRVIDHMI